MSRNQTRLVLVIITCAVITVRFIFFPKGDDVLEKGAEKYSTYRGIVSNDPVSSRFILKVAKVNEEDVKGTHKILVKADGPIIRYGDEVEIQTSLKKPERIVNEDGRTFDYAAYLRKDKIFYTTTASAKIVGREHGSRIFTALYDFKHTFVDHINHILPSPHAFLANGLIVTGKATLSKEMQTEFQRVGLIHIVVLSGYNVTIVGESIARLFSFLPLTVSTILGATAIILFSIMTGGGSTVIRATIMSIIGLYARISGRQSTALSSLIIAGLGMSIWNPMLPFYDPSFQMSFAATLGLILYSEPFEKVLQPLKKILVPHWLISLISSALSTQLFTLPLIMYLSGVVSLIALPANILVLPFIPFTMFFVFASGAASFTLPILSLLPAFISYLMLSYELAVVNIASSFSFAAIKLPPVSIYAVLVAYTFLTFVGVKVYGKVREENVSKSKKPPP